MNDLVSDLIAHIDEDLCQGSRSCLPACSNAALLLVPGERAPFVDRWSCTGCGNCATMCPHHAIRLHTVEA